MAKNLTTGLQRGLRQSIAGGLGTGDLFSIASLDLQFARHKSLDSRVTHTRQSSATYVDGDGVIKTAVTNLLLRSEEFDNSNWTGASPTVTPNVALSPDGTTTADKVEVAPVRQTANPVTAGANYAISFYIKSDETTAAAIRLRTGYSGGSSNLWWIPSTGLFGTVGTNFSNAAVTLIGNSWYRVSAIFTVPSGVTAVEFAISGVNANGGGTVSDHFVIWGAQLEESSTVGQYVKTTTAINSAPRFDHDPETGESLGLLVEESRTNLLTYSEDFSSGFSAQNASIVVNQIVAPDETSTADKFIPDDTANRHYIQFNLGSSLIQYTGSIYAKAGELSTITLRVGRATSIGEGAKVDLTDGSLIYQGTDIDSASVENVGNGWYRIIVTNTCTIVGAQYFAISHDDQDSTAGDGTSGIYLWGAQIEAGSFPTSYIPTEGSTVTRAADVASITGTNFSSWYEQSEGTVFSSSRHKSVTARTLAFTDGTSNNAMQQYLLANTAAMDSYVSNSWQGSGATTSTFVADQQFNVASTIQTNSGVTAASGALGTVDTSYGIPTVDRLLIGQSRSSDNTNGTISRLTYWPTRLSNDTLQTITV